MEQRHPEMSHALIVDQQVQLTEAYWAIQVVTKPHIKWSLLCPRPEVDKKTEVGQTELWEINLVT